ncbi:GumC family protein [Jhaorihella thermophila]
MERTLDEKVRNNRKLIEPRGAQTAPLMLQQPVEDDEIDLLQVVRTLWRGKLWIAFTTLVAILIAGYYVFVAAVPVYTAESYVALDSRQGQVVDFENVISGLSGDQATINTELEVLKSRGLTRKLVNELNLVEDPEFNSRLLEEPGFSLGTLQAWVRGMIAGEQEVAPPPTPEIVLEEVVTAVKEKINVSNIRNSYVFKISVTTEDPEKSAKIANTLADLYIVNQLDVKFDATRKATDWLAERVALLERDLAEAETAVKDFNARTELVSPEALEALNRQAKDTRDRIAILKSNLATQEAQLARLEQAWESKDRAAMAEVAAEIGGDRAPTPTMSDRVFQTRYLQLMNSTKAAVARSRSQIESLSAAVAQIEEQIKMQSQDLVQLEQLTRKAEALRSVYEYFLNRLQETSAQQGIQQADSRVLSEAVIPTVPSAPKKARIFALAAILGMMLGAAFVLLREFTNRTVRTADDLENLTRLPVLGQVPMIPGGKRRGQIEYLAAKPESAGAEAIRNLRTSILYSNVDQPPQVVMLTSSIPGEGKTTLSIALAQSFAGLNKRVLLIEGDMRRQAFKRYFQDQHDGGGLLSVLTGRQSLTEAVQKSGLVGADLLRAEKTSVNAADVFASDRFSELIAEARASYDIVIIDTPPVLVVPDARTIAQVADALVFSVKWDSTEQDQIVDAIRMFESVNIRPTGLVLNMINRKGMKKYGYGGKYGAYARYGAKYYKN